jgi:hypothetical protein
MLVSLDVAPRQKWLKLFGFFWSRFTGSLGELLLVLRFFGLDDRQLRRVAGLGRIDIAIDKLGISLNETVHGWIAKGGQLISERGTGQRENRENISQGQCQQ